MRAAGVESPRGARKAAIRHLIALSLLCGLLFFYRLADRDLWNSHEARAAMDAQTILDDGCWGLPHLYDGRPELQKPPLYYWLVALIAWGNGGVVDAWAVRLPAALAGLGCVLLLYRFGQRLGRPVAGLAAALILATAMHFTWLARVGRIDMPLTLTIMLTLTGAYLAGSEQGVGRGWLLLAYLAVAVGLLLKGPIAAVLPGATLGVHLLCTSRDRKRAAEQIAPLRSRLVRAGSHFGIWWGVPLVLLLAGPWYLWVYRHTGGEFFRVFFWHHNVERGLGGSALRAHPWWFYGPQFLFDFLPWSPLLILAGIGWWKCRGWRPDPEARFGLVWLLTMLVLLSCFRFKRADYLLPAYPGAALFLGCIAERSLREAKYPRLAAGLGGAVVGAAAVGWLVHVTWGLPRLEPTREYRRFAEAIRAHAPPPAPVLFFRTESHALAFHVGRPVHEMIWWDELDAWASRPGVHYVVMPAAVARERSRFLRSCELEEVVGNQELAGGRHEKPLLLLRSRPLTAEGALPYR
jgi:4-amino-4-deoxy-L-arabinose transferase-like glycosyltransferase